jgi:L(+)-tartrate dehydratase alpha subunit
VRSAFTEALQRENEDRAREAFRSTLRSLDLSVERMNPACPDSGWPLFFVKAGNDVNLEGGFLALEAVVREQVAAATAAGYLRATMKHPLTGYDPGTNVGPHVPDVTYQFVPGADLQVSYVAKGGGSECFGGTRYRMIAFADGLVGIKKFIVDAFAASARAGAICPPPILGIGTGNIAANLAKQAACLRLIGSRHPEPAIADLEDELLRGLNALGIGPMGIGGQTSVFAVHVEYAYTHLAGIAVATSSNCWIARRATVRIEADGRLEDVDDPDWFNRR